MFKLTLNDVHRGSNKMTYKIPLYISTLFSIVSIMCFFMMLSCDSNEDCPVNPEYPSKYVIVGFWSNTDCSGDPVAVNSFPVKATEGCYCWPGNSGENSADQFSCNPDQQSFTYTQYGSLTCGADDNTPTQKTVYMDQCKQDIPPTLYSKIINYGACTAQ